MVGLCFTQATGLGIQVSGVLHDTNSGVGRVEVGDVVAFLDQAFIQPHTRIS